MGGFVAHLFGWDWRSMDEMDFDTLAWWHERYQEIVKEYESIKK